MLKLIARRLMLLIVILVAVSMLTFAIVNVLPGDVAVAILGETATPADVAALRTRLGLDQPLVQRYIVWMMAFVQGDFGTSLSFNQPVAPVLLGRLSNSIILAALVLIAVVPLSIGLGVVAAIYEGKAVDRIVSAASVVGYALPEFVIGLTLILLFSILYPILPGSSLIEPGASPLSRPSALVLPVVVLVIHQIAHLSQITRASTIKALGSHFVRTAVLKGLPRRRVIWRHAVPNAMSPVIAEIGMNFGYVLGGLVVVETLFSYSGIGQLMVMSVETRDIPTLQATVLLIAAAYGFGNLFADVATLYLNPRLRE